MGIFIFIRIEKKHSYYHSQKKRPNSMCFDLFFIYSLELKFLLRSLISSFFNTLMVARSSIRSILKSKIRMRGEQLVQFAGRLSTSLFLQGFQFLE